MVVELIGFASHRLEHIHNQASSEKAGHREGDVGGGHALIHGSVESEELRGDGRQEVMHAVKLSCDKRVGFVQQRVVEGRDDVAIAAMLGPKRSIIRGAVRIGDANTQSSTRFTVETNAPIASAVETRIAPSRRSAWTRLGRPAAMTCWTLVPGRSTS